MIIIRESQQINTPLCVIERRRYERRSRCCGNVAVNVSTPAKGRRVAAAQENHGPGDDETPRPERTPFTFLWQRVRTVLGNKSRQLASQCEPRTDQCRVVLHRVKTHTPRNERHHALCMQLVLCCSQLPTAGGGVVTSSSTRDTPGVRRVANVVVLAVAVVVVKRRPNGWIDDR